MYKLHSNFFKWQKNMFFSWDRFICIQLYTASREANNLETSSVNINSHWSNANHTCSLLVTSVTDGLLRTCNLNGLFLAEVPWIAVVELHFYRRTSENCFLNFCKTCLMSGTEDSLDSRSPLDKVLGFGLPLPYSWCWLVRIGGQQGLEGSCDEGRD